MPYLICAVYRVKHNHKIVFLILAGITGATVQDDLQKATFKYKKTVKFLV